MAPGSFARLALFSSAGLPVTALSIAAYLVNHPLASSRTRSIVNTDSLLPSCTSSPSSFSIANPCNHVALTNSHSLRLSKKEVGRLTDEEILSRFVKGFFGGWIFAPEKALLATLRVFGVAPFLSGFTGIKPSDAMIRSPVDLSRDFLPVPHTPLFGGNFLVMDVSLKPDSEEEGAEFSKGSYIDIGFGDDRKTFSGLHRFEVVRLMDRDSDGAILCFSSMSCNPKLKEKTSHTLLFKFHRAYSLALFRDGVAEILSG